MDAGTPGKASGSQSLSSRKGLYDQVHKDSRYAWCSSNVSEKLVVTSSDNIVTDWECCWTPLNTTNIQQFQFRRGILWNEHGQSKVLWFGWGVSARWPRTQKYHCPHQNWGPGRVLPRYGPGKLVLINIFLNCRQATQTFNTILSI